MRTGYYPSSNYFGLNQWHGETVEDIQFLDKQGIPRIMLNAVSSPHNVANLAKAEMKLNK
jgi:hypothetical protein